MTRTRGRLFGVLLLSLTVAACTPSSAGRVSWTFPPAPAIPASGAPTSPSASAGVGTTTDGASSTGAGAQAAGAVISTLEIHAVDLAFQPSTLTVEKAGTYAVKLVNDGSILHNVTFADGTAISAGSKQTATGLVNVPAAGIAFICSVPGHADAGMKGTITVAGQPAAAGSGTTGGAAAPTASADSHGGPAPITDVAPDPNAPAYTPYDATAPAVLPGTVHDITLTVQEKLMTVAPGFVQNVWTFNGTVPGPVIRVHLGDTVNIHLVNPATNTMPHSVDFHASQVAWNGPMTSINPGEDKMYVWHADYAGVWMYHCGTAPALHHIANGMYGMVIVEPKGGLPPVDREFALVQSEWYLGPQGQPVSLSKAAAAAPAPDYVVFNGVANQYKDNPLKVPTGGSVRIFILDAGPNEDSSFHIVGTIFNTVIKEGIALRPGNDGGWGSQAVDLSPAQGAIVEFRTAEDGLYPVVTHAFNFVGRGALGLVQAGDGKYKPRP